jgi:hypothetical protein
MAARTFHALDSNARVFQDEKGRAMTAAEVATALGWPRLAAELDRPSTRRAGYARPGEEKAGANAEREYDGRGRVGGGIADWFRKDKAPDLKPADIANQVTLLFRLAPKGGASSSQPTHVFELAGGYRTTAGVQLVKQANEKHWVPCEEVKNGVEQSAKVFFPALTGNRLAKQQRVLAVRARPVEAEPDDAPFVPEAHYGNIRYSSGEPNTVPTRLIPVTEISGGSRNKTPTPLFVGLYVQGPKLADPTRARSQLGGETGKAFVAAQTMYGFGLARGEFLAQLPRDGSEQPDWNLVLPSHLINDAKKKTMFSADAFPLALKLTPATLHRVICAIDTAVSISFGQWKQGVGATNLTCDGVGMATGDFRDTYVSANDLRAITLPASVPMSAPAPAPAASQQSAY